MAGGKASLADITGQDARTGQEARLLAVVVPQVGQTWFYKLMGDAKVVERREGGVSQVRADGQILAWRLWINRGTR